MVFTGWSPLFLMLDCDYLCRLSLIATFLFFLTLCNQLRAFTDGRDDLSLGHVVVLLQHDWPQGEMLFLKAVDKICQQGSFQYENFFNYVTSILFCVTTHTSLK